jgi:predicted rRNA methylase YqxC with S4 and FtsJ domains
MTAGEPKMRVDLLLVERGLVPSRERARAYILAGRVLVREQKIDKPGTMVPRIRRSGCWARIRPM